MSNSPFPEFCHRSNGWKLLMFTNTSLVPQYCTPLLHVNLWDDRDIARVEISSCFTRMESSYSLSFLSSSHLNYWMVNELAMRVNYISSRVICITHNVTRITLYHILSLSDLRVSKFLPATKGKCITVQEFL